MGVCCSTLFWGVPCTHLWPVTVSPAGRLSRLNSPPLDLASSSNHHMVSRLCQQLLFWKSLSDSISVIMIRLAEKWLNCMPFIIFFSVTSFYLGQISTCPSTSSTSGIQDHLRVNDSMTSSLSPELQQSCNPQKRCRKMKNPCLI